LEKLNLFSGEDTARLTFRISKDDSMLVPTASNLDA